MARNSEKAMTALARWRNAKLAEDGLDTKNERRPYLATQCNNLKSAEKWRIQVIREASKKMAQIQNAGLGEFRIRDLNDEINKLLREKRHWENRIIELGGRDKRSRSRMLDKEGILFLFLLSKRFVCLNLWFSQTSTGLSVGVGHSIACFFIFDANSIF